MGLTADLVVGLSPSCGLQVLVESPGPGGSEYGGAKVKLAKFLRIVGLSTAIMFLSRTSYAFDLTGAWTDNVSACRNIFEKNTQGMFLTKSGSGIYGDAFIVRGNLIVGNAAACTIKSRKVRGPITDLVATCATGNVALSTFQFSYRVKDENAIVRIFPGIKELDVTYGRCRL